MKRFLAVILVLATLFPTISLAVDQTAATSQRAYEQWESFANKRISELVKSYEKSKTLGSNDIIELTNLVIARMTAEGANAVAAWPLIGESLAEADLSFATLIASYYSRYEKGTMKKAEYLRFLIDAAKDLTD